MRVLYVDISLNGHRLGYMKALTHDVDSIALIPYYTEDLNCEQEVISSSFVSRRSPYSYIQFLLEINRVACERNVDIVHILCGDAFYRFFGIGLFLVKKPIVMTFHHMQFTTIKKIAIRSIFNNIYCGIVHTEYLYAHLCSLGVHNSVLVDYPLLNEKLSISKKEARMYFNLPQDKIILVTLGGTQHYKGLDILLEALKLVNRDFFLFCTGVIRDLKEKEISMLTSSYSENVMLNMKRLSDQEFTMAIIASDIVVLPYRKVFDGASGLMIEAVWYKKYIIGSGHGSMGGLIRQYKLGSVFETENINSLSTIIKKVLSNGIEWSNSAEEFRKKLDVDFFVDRHTSLYNQVLNKKNCV